MVFTVRGLVYWVLLYVIFLRSLLQILIFSFAVKILRFVFLNIPLAILERHQNYFKRGKGGEENFKLEGKIIQDNYFIQTIIPKPLPPHQICSFYVAEQQYLTSTLYIQIIFMFSFAYHLFNF